MEWKNALIRLPLIQNSLKNIVRIYSNLLKIKNKDRNLFIFYKYKKYKKKNKKI